MRSNNYRNNIHPNYIVLTYSRVMMPVQNSHLVVHLFDFYNQQTPSYLKNHNNKNNKDKKNKKDNKNNKNNNKKRITTTTTTT